MGPDLADPFIPFFYMVSSTFAGKGEHHLSCSTRFSDNAKSNDEIPDRVLSWFDGLYGDKRNFFWRQEVFYSVNEDDSFTGENRLKRDRFYMNPLGPYQYLFITTKFWIVHALPFHYLSTVGCLPRKRYLSFPCYRWTFFS